MRLVFFTIQNDGAKEKEREDGREMGFERETKKERLKRGMNQAALSVNFSRLFFRERDSASPFEQGKALRILQHKLERRRF